MEGLNQISVIKQSGEEVISLHVDREITVEGLKKAIYHQFSKYPPARQRLQIKAGERTVDFEDDKKKLVEYGAKDGSVIVFVDLGPQVNKQRALILQLLGALILYPVCFLFPYSCYGVGFHISSRSSQDQILLLCFTFHFGKELLQALFDQSLRIETLSFYRVCLQCAYRWGSTLFLSYYTNSPFWKLFKNTEAVIVIGFAIFMIGEVGTIYCSTVIRQSRQKATAGHQRAGYLFELVSAPNYTFELISWMGFSVMAQSFPASVVTLLELFRLGSLAKGVYESKSKDRETKRHAACSCPRKALIPFIF